MFSFPSTYALAAAFLCLPAFLTAGEKVVAPQGSDSAPGTAEKPWKTLAFAGRHLQAGDTLRIRKGIYRDRLVVEASGSEAAGYITIHGEPGAVLSGEGGTGKYLVLIDSQSYVKVTGLELADSKGLHDGSAIRVTGHGSHIELRGNRIHGMRGRDAMGITVYGTSPEQPIEDIIIDGNEIYDCEPARSEALTLNGNVTGFEVTNNRLHDLNNIGIDFIGGEASICPDKTKVARNGLCKGNTVWRCRSRYEGGYAAGIYVDGGRNIVIEGNVVTECDLGLEVGAENKGVVATGIIVKNNILFHNDKAGLVLGGFEKNVGRVQDCKFLNNTCYQNDRHKKDQNGELWIQWASGNEVSGNTFVSGEESPLVQLDEGGVSGNTLRRNRYYSPAGIGDAAFLWRDKDVNGFPAWQRISGQDAESTFGEVDVALPTVGGR